MGEPRPRAPGRTRGACLTALRTICLRVQSCVHERDRRHRVHRLRLPVGLLGEPRAGRAALALRRAARWRIVTIGLAEDPQIYIDRGYTPTRAAVGALSFRRFGMPFLLTPRASGARDLSRLPDDRRHAPARPAARARGAARAAARLVQQPAAARRARGPARCDARGRRAGSTPTRIVAAIDDRGDGRAVRGRQASRRARPRAGPTDFQGKARQTDGPVRYSAPSLVSSRHEDGRSLEAGGFQTIEAYDVLIANLDTTLDRRPPAEDPRRGPARLPGRRW